MDEKPIPAQSLAYGSAPPKKKQAPVFDEETYLRLNPDVRQAVAAGTFRSGLDHYERYGRAEGRPCRAAGQGMRDRVVLTGNPATSREQPKIGAAAVDAVIVSRSGGIFIVGWVNDPVDPLDSIELYFTAWSITFDGAGLARLRRPDAEKALGNTRPHAFGFWGFNFAGQALPAGSCNAVLRLKSGAEASYVLVSEQVEDDDLRTIVLGHLAETQYFGNPYFEAVLAIERTIGQQIVDFNKLLSRRAITSPYAERFGASGRRYKASLVVCLYGRPEYMFLQNALFARQPGMADVEFIYVCNSPHLAEQLLKEARLCQNIYGLDMSLILLNSNGGFGAANNVATQFASSDRLVIMNPDVFPHDPHWVLKHTEAVETLPPEQTALFGAPLYYDDGSLMHAGMYFSCDTAPSFVNGRKLETSLLRVEHYGKGAPPDTAQFVKSRKVPAVTGALTSVARPWFEKLGGFTQDYVFGHYEDADFCLKSIAAGRFPWLHDLRLWHLEGKGSTRKPEHEGGSIVNRWLFSKTWLDTVQRGLMGPEPAHPGLRQSAAGAAETGTAERLSA